MDYFIIDNSISTAAYDLDFIARRGSFFVKAAVAKLQDNPFGNEAEIEGVDDLSNIAVADTVDGPILIYSPIFYQSALNRYKFFVFPI